MSQRETRQQAAGRRNLRERKINQKLGVVDESSRQQAVQARLDALEADNEAADDQFAGGSDDDDFMIAGDGDSDEEEVEISGKRKRKKGSGAASNKRKTRGGNTEQRSSVRIPKSFQRLLEEAQLDKLPAGTPNYIAAAAGPSTAFAARKFCSVCGNSSAYTCPRCGSRYCCRRCHVTHVETRCLKFIG